jgi:hypothetical protein
MPDRHQQGAFLSLITTSRVGPSLHESLSTLVFLLLVGDRFVSELELGGEPAEVALPDGHLQID